MNDPQLTYVKLEFGVTWANEPDHRVRHIARARMASSREELAQVVGDMIGRLREWSESVVLSPPDERTERTIDAMVRKEEPS